MGKKGYRREQLEIWERVLGRKRAFTEKRVTLQKMQLEKDIVTKKLVIKKFSYKKSKVIKKVQL